MCRVCALLEQLDDPDFPIESLVCRQQLETTIYSRVGECGSLVRGQSLLGTIDDAFDFVGQGTSSHGRAPSF